MRALKITEIRALVESLGYPAAYYEFKNGTVEGPPFVCWILSGSDDFYADNSNYQRKETLTIEFYTDVKDFAGEHKIEGILTAAGLTWEREEAFLDDERMHQTNYTMEVLLNEQ